VRKARMRRVPSHPGQRRGKEFVEAAEFVVGPCEADDVGAPACVGGQDAVVAVAMRAGRGNQPSESLEEFERSEPKGNERVISPLLAIWMANAFILGVVLLLVWQPSGAGPAREVETLAIGG